MSHVIVILVVLIFVRCPGINVPLKRCFHQRLGTGSGEVHAHDTFVIRYVSSCAQGMDKKEAAQLGV